MIPLISVARVSPSTEPPHGGRGPCRAGGIVGPVSRAPPGLETISREDDGKARPERAARGSWTPRTSAGGAGMLDRSSNQLSARGRRSPPILGGSADEVRPHRPNRGALSAHRRGRAANDEAPQGMDPEYGRMRGGAGGLCADHGTTSDGAPGRGLATPRAHPDL